MSGKVGSGIRFSFVGTVIAGLLQFGFMTVLARLLTPDQYGVYALCFAIVSLSAIFVTNVTERALVVTEHDEGEPDESPVIFLLCIGASLVAFLACVGINRFAARPIDLGVLALLALGTCIASAAIVPRVGLRRQLHFGLVMGAELIGLLLGQGLTAISLAASGWGSYALGAAYCVQSLAIVVTLRCFTKGAALALPTPQNLMRLVRRSLALGGNAATEIVNGQIASLVLGGRLGATPLGLYNRAYSLVQMPIQMLVSSLGRVMVSVLFSVSADRERLQSASRSLVMMASVVASPVAAGMAGSSRNFVLAAFGPDWLATLAIMPLIALGAWAVMMGTLFGIIAEALRAFAGKMRAQVTSSIVLALAALAGTRWGLAPAVAGVVLGAFTYLVLNARLASGLIGVSFGTALGWLMPGLAIALPCFLASWAIGLAWAGPPVLVLITQVAACGLIELAMLLMIFPAIALRIIETGFPPALRWLPRLNTYLHRATIVRAP